jgi:hypothetical protein
MEADEAELMSLVLIVLVLFVIVEIREPDDTAVERLQATKPAEGETVQ